MSNEPSNVQRHPIGGDTDRRGFLRIGGIGVGLAALLAACGNTEAGELGRVGVAPSVSKLPDAPVSDAVYLRTLASLQRSLVTVYDKAIAEAELLDPEMRPLMQRLRDDADAAAKRFDALTVGAGGTPWLCGNPKFDSSAIEPALKRIATGIGATPEAEAIPASDDKRRDILALVHGMESIICASGQRFVEMVAQRFRVPVVETAVGNARHAALLAIRSNPARPDGYVAPGVLIGAPAAPAPSTTTTEPAKQINQQGQNPGNAATTLVPSTGGAAPTEIPPITAIPGSFGSTSAEEVVVGAGDQNGTRLKLQLETVSLNSFVYDYQTAAC